MIQKNLYDFDKQENVFRIGNEQLLSGRIGGLQHLRFPDASVEKLVEKLVKISKRVREKARTVFEEKGCDSEEAQAAQKAWVLYTKVPPWQLNSLIDREIVKNGGTVTPPKKIESTGKKSNQAE